VLVASEADFHEPMQSLIAIAGNHFLAESKNPLDVNQAGFV
jgi:hypothetical protein